jgi:glycogen synthase
MLISRPYLPDIRAQKEAHTLALMGHRVHIIAWDRDGTYPRHALEHIPPPLDAALANWPVRSVAQPAPVGITHIPLPAGYRTGRWLLCTLPRFWWRAWHELRRIRPDVVHAHDLDTLLLAYLYARHTGVPVVYDAREYYPGMVRATVGPRFSRALEWLDGWLTPRVDAVLTVGERLADRLRAMGGRVWVVPNAQPLPDAAALAGAGRAYRRRIGVPADGLLVVYVGWLSPDRVLAPLLDAVQGLPDVWLVIGGEGPQRPQVEAAAAACPRIQTLGWVPLHEVMTVVAAGDVVYYGLDARNLNSVYFMPNLGYYALAAGRPVLTTPVGEIAAVVRREGCGVVLPSATPAAARLALQALADPVRRAALAARARAAGRRDYNWQAAADRLWQAYANIAVVKNCI